MSQISHRRLILVYGVSVHGVKSETNSGTFCTSEGALLCGTAVRVQPRVVCCRHHGPGVCGVRGSRPLLETREIGVSELETGRGQAARVSAEFPGKLDDVTTPLPRLFPNGHTSCFKICFVDPERFLLFFSFLGAKQHRSWQRLCQKPAAGQRR